MQNQILKYAIPMKPQGGHPLPCVMMPPNATVLSCAMTEKGFTVWAMCPKAGVPASEPHYFAIVTTGQDLPEAMADCRFLATVQYHMADKPQKMRVSHVFEVPPGLAKALTQPPQEKQ